MKPKEQGSINKRLRTKLSHVREHNTRAINSIFSVFNRTNFFMKENKYYSHLNFWLPIGYVFALGIFFNEESRSTKVLHRDQTDEWKG
jgi:hypothetical protein